MDDLLIVRMSDRSRERWQRSRRGTPLGANLGMLLGLPLALVFGSALQGEAPVYVAIGAAIGLAIGGIFGRFLANPRKPNPQARRRYYSGLPLPSDEEDKEATDESAYPNARNL